MVRCFENREVADACLAVASESDEKGCVIWVDFPKCECRSMQENQTKPVHFTSVLVLVI